MYQRVGNKKQITVGNKKRISKSMSLYMIIGIKIIAITLGNKKQITHVTLTKTYRWIYI
jgi:hypothetical protein